ncbi:hypothetical protein [Sporisorium scitamineum]|uniref:Uncharacterized protein n=1 Tax=Sporisorium scitamineum TaxID=49012 RepID=A0A0F7SAW7_9BASI|nr:hypothetical protein [Sporisorium scitamineum]
MAIYKAKKVTSQLEQVASSEPHNLFSPARRRSFFSDIANGVDPTMHLPRSG